MTAYIKTGLGTLLIFLLSFGGAFAGDKDFPAVQNPPRLVNDFAHFMSADQADQLEVRLLAFEDSTSNQIAIVTVQSIGPYDVADYSVELFNRWKIGTAKNKNGVLILAAKDERKIWITTGYGLEGALPDGLLGQIIREEIQPSFKAGDFYTGLDQGVTAIMDASRGEYKGTPHRADGAPKRALPLGVIIFIVIFVIIAIARGGRGGGGGGGGLLNSAGWIAMGLLNSSNNRSSGWGGGGFGGGGGGGGFGGFGGGSSGGGGAGGSW